MFDVCLRPTFSPPWQLRLLSHLDFLQTSTTTQKKQPTTKIYYSNTKNKKGLTDGLGAPQSTTKTG